MSTASSHPGPEAPSPGEPEYIPIARVDRARGLHGEVVVTVHADDPGRLGRLGSIFFRDPAGGLREAVIERVVRVGNRCGVKLAGIGSIREARGLVGQELLIPPSASTPAPPGRYYAYQLAGMAARLKDGSFVGTVREVLRHGSKSLLVVESQRGEILVPFVRAICVAIDVQGRTVTLDPPEGLLELNETGSGRG